MRLIASDALRRSLIESEWNPKLTQSESRAILVESSEEIGWLLDLDRGEGQGWIWKIRHAPPPPARASREL